MALNHLVDPELIRVLEAYPDTELNQDTLAATRRMRDKQALEMKAILPKMEEVTQKDYLVPGLAGGPDVSVRVYKPGGQTEKLPGFLWIHGGGYVLGGMDGDDYPNKLRVQKTGCVIVSVDYRLAPENPYPAPLEDCHAALQWMFDHADELGIDKSRVAIGGASAGGGLAASLALLVRDRAELKIIFQMLIYPMIDDRNIAPASETRPDTLIWSRAKNLFGWTSYLGRPPGKEDITAYEAAARAKDLSGLPPALVVVGDLDLFVAENIEYARRLICAGIPTELHVYPGAYHGFNGFAPGAAVSRQCNDTCYRALNKALYQA
ncbi:MAG: alpha/beta hydrolase [Proteobacteria bacterium]|nr:alpha/beta hydrolase [Pseudomonadota bacterium]MBU4469919.1 alpha/beta hydrolase [Pseudomonadota bacterium]MCG2751605.1 alpha/beta hydrolase [Desulfobacteraceae bacterium]